MMKTNELRNLDIEKMQNMPEIKPKKNPVHEEYIDDINEVFNKFDINHKHHFANGGNNIIYINKKFTLRISRKYLKPENETFNTDYHINIHDKKEDEYILMKAVKHKISPHVYFMGNIMLKSKIRRYNIIESYDMSLAQFFKRRTYESVIENYSYYDNTRDLYNDINKQISDILDKINKMGYVYYDFKPDNIVLNINDGRVILKVIDWDREFCVCEPWMFNDDIESHKNTTKGIKFMNLLMLSYSMYIQYDNNILHNIIRQLFSQNIFDTIYNILFKTENLYIQIIIHYYYNSFQMSIKERDKFFNLSLLEQDKKLIYILVHMIRMSFKENKYDTILPPNIEFNEYQKQLLM